MERGALEGIRIADFAWAWAGAYATELLAFMGAEVIKIESKQRPEQSRLRSLTTGQQFTGLNQSTVFNDLNLNKLGISLNLSHPEGVELAKRLIQISDIVIQNMRPGVMAKLGLDYESVQKIKPDIIYLSSSARGNDGLERGYAGYAPNFASLAGVSYVTGYADGTPGYMMGEIDLLSATTAAFALLAALNYQAATGEGQHIDLSSAEANAMLVGDILLDYTLNGRVQSRQGNRDDLMAPHNCYRCRGQDKWVSIAIATEEEWKTLCRCLDEPEWSREERFSDSRHRLQHQEELDKLIEAWTINHTHYEVMEILQASGVAAVPSFNSEELFHNPHLRERGFWSKVSHPVIGEQVVAAPPWKLSATPARVKHSAPLLGEHNRYVFGELLGIRDEEIARLEEERVIY